ncbi:hypothetical protein GCM10011403_29400 [Pseudohongiella nitratireducens]|uniref:Uncharacterized protein n=1 Tax=Pseudohongiella nitratireducens TaxID=1768907 RepID=A0A916QPH5_9GAMM|nr:hypothetical protein [Pseudohongiella nitratireducens]GFZ83924.1 hypothetical protein GCM10011403_29400 [Pseudohongiella nitratireducens]
MPVLPYAIAFLAAGAGVKFIGDGLSDTADGVTKVALVAGVGFGGYWLAKKNGVIK